MGLENENSKYILSHRNKKQLILSFEKELKTINTTLAKNKEFLKGYLENIDPKDDKYTPVVAMIKEIDAASSKLKTQKLMK